MVCLLRRRLRHLAQPRRSRGGCQSNYSESKYFAKTLKFSTGQCFIILHNPCRSRGGCRTNYSESKYFFKTLKFSTGQSQTKYSESEYFAKNATQVFHRAGLKILISLTEAMLARMAVLLTGGHCSFPSSRRTCSFFPFQH
jgi:hypothetical protein